MARACGVSQAAVHKWAVGKSKPSALSAKRLKEQPQDVLLLLSYARSI
jgi:DNA-binding transcriptional regulator YiaG